MAEADASWRDTSIARRIWWVANNDDACESLLRELRAAGLACELLSCSEAMARLRTGSFDADGAVIDVSSLHHGDVALKALRATGAPLVLLLEAEDLSLVARGLNLGMAGVVKPVPAQTLLAALRLPGGDTLTPAGGTFPFRTLEEVAGLSQLVAGLCPDPASVQIALSELMINAVEHGNLGLGFERKCALMEAGQWRNEVERLLDEPEYAERLAWLRVECRPREVRFLVRDQGGGFDPDPYLELDASRSVEPYGRGIAMARVLAFDELVFLDEGRCVEAVVKR